MPFTLRVKRGTIFRLHSISINTLLSIKVHTTQFLCNSKESKSIEKRPYFLQVHKKTRGTIFSLINALLFYAIAEDSCHIP